MAQKIVERVSKHWKPFFQKHTQQPYMRELSQFLNEQKQLGKTIYPPVAQWFQAYLSVPFERVRVVIIGQDPYHGPNQAHGLSFSVPQGVKPPPSLVNIFKELERDGLCQRPEHGCLQSWAEQGVFLLNSVLTVEAGDAGSHAKKGWEVFTQASVDYLNEEKAGLVFLAWGRYAHRVCQNIDTNKHCLIKTSHPSPLGAHKQGSDFDAFIGSACFSRANDYLKAHEQAAIDWQI